MTTVRQIERHWTAKAYKRLLTELTAGRAGALFGLDEFRPAQEKPDPDDDPTREWRERWGRGKRKPSDDAT